MSKLNDIEDELKHLHEIMKLQIDSITEIYAQASKLVDSNAEIAKRMRALHLKAREERARQ